ncbi:hypothetical protein, partial [Tetragenococcus koreensis]|uniref:hypothetical protein n=1 Tax=Tetragenococcus koreensis TaxID=290335 RepID=UPI001F4544F6
RERVKDRETLHLIRVFLKAGIMENGFVSPNETGVPQGSLCEASHKPPYAKYSVMQSKLQKAYG